jgi:hypothetical protein
MLTLKNKLVASGLTAGLLAVTALAHANTVTQSFNIPNQPPGVQNIVYNLFDSNLGTLSSVTLELVLNGTANVTVFNTQSFSQSFTNAFTSFPLTVTGPPGPTTFITTTLSANIPSGTVPGGGETFPGTPAHTDSGVINVPIIDWGSYQTPGGGVSLTDLVFTAGAASSGVTGPADGSLGAGGGGTVGDPSSFLTLIYNFQPPASPGTPEPGAWALLVASGAVSVAGLRRRRAAK